MAPDILKAFAIGICASAPLGPISILVIQKSLSYGRKAGFISGLGATVVDTTYSIISVFAFAAAKDFINTYQYLIYVIGGLIVTLLGLSMAFRDPFRKMELGEDRHGVTVGDYLQAVAMGFSNPGAVFVILALFAFFGIDLENAGKMVIFPVIVAIATGSALYWFLFSWFFSHWRSVIKMRALIWLNRVAGIIIMIIGLALMGEGLYEVLFPRA